jgi:hypothetical protein
MKSINIWKIIAALFFCLLASIILVFIDRYFPLFTINNYGEIYLVIWQVQATVASLSVLGLSLFANNLNIKIYGKKYGDIVAKSTKQLSFSYWEIMILSIILVPVNFFGVVFGSMTTVMFIFMVNSISVILLIWRNTEVLVNSEVIRNAIRKEIMEVIMRCEENRPNRFLDIQNLAAHTEELYQVKDLKCFEENLDLLHDLLNSAIEQERQDFCSIIQYRLVCIFRKVTQQGTPDYIIGLLEKAIDMAVKGEKKSSTLIINHTN